jgi:hypothetical protein
MLCLAILRDHLRDACEPVYADGRIKWHLGKPTSRAGHRDVPYCTRGSGFARLRSLRIRASHGAAGP